tara:strand:+ start:2983 stop:5019 length:2037 start_codon:yes stop_codon:yes gene_type:complete
MPVPIIVGAIVGGAVAAGAAAVGLVAASVLTAAAIGAAVGAVAGALSGSLLGGMFDTPDYNVTNNAQAENDGILVNKTGMLEHIPVVYGQRKVGGTIVYLSTNGDRNKYLYMALVLAEGEIESIDEIYINDIISTDARYNGRFTFQKFTGTDGQSASSILSESGADWTSAHKLSGIAYLACRFEWKKIEDQDDADANPYSGIPNIKCVIKGKKVKSAATAGSVEYASETGQIYSNNPADCLLDYMRNPRYGKGLVNARINFPSFLDSRSRYAEQVTYVTGATGPVLTCDTVIKTSRQILDNVKLFLANARSGMPYVQGQFKLKLMDGGGTTSQSTSPTIVYAVTQREIVGGVKLQANGTRDHFNQVKITYVDPANEWKTNEVIFPSLNSTEDTTYLAEDNGRRLTKEMAFNHIINKNIAADIASIILRQSRKRKHIELTTTAELHEAEVGDIITVTYAPLGFDVVKYRINSIKINNDYTINLTASEHEASNYVFSDTNIIYGVDTQRRYVGNGALNITYQQTPITVGGAGTVSWLPTVTTPPTSAVPTLPINTVSGSTATMSITSIAQTAAYDRPSFATESLRMTCVIADSFIDQVNRIDLQELSGVTNTYVSRTTLNPTTLARSGSNYLVDVNSELDGRLHTFRLLATLDNGDTIPSAIKTHTAALSVYRTTAFVSF